MEMTIDNLLKDYKNGVISGRVLITYAKRKYLKDCLKEKTNFLPDDSSVEERLYYLIHDLKEIQLCPYCGKHQLKFSGRIKDGFLTSCCADKCKRAHFAAKHVGVSSKINVKEAFKKLQESLKKKDINDEFIEKVFFRFNKLNRACFKILTNKDLISYLTNRFTDSNSIEESLYRIHLKIEKKPLCPWCHKLVTFIGKPSKMFTTYCSNYCSNKATKSNRNH